MRTIHAIRVWRVQLDGNIPGASLGGVQRVDFLLNFFLLLGRGFLEANEFRIGGPELGEVSNSFGVDRTTERVLGLPEGGEV